jgi:hypothetical protein
VWFEERRATARFLHHVTAARDSSLLSIPSLLPSLTHWTLECMVGSISSSPMARKALEYFAAALVNISELDGFEGYPRSIADTAGFLATLDMVSFFMVDGRDDRDEGKEGLDPATSAFGAIERLQDGGDADDNAIQLLDSYCQLITSDLLPLGLETIGLLCKHSSVLVPFFKPDATPSLSRLLKSTVRSRAKRAPRRTWLARRCR